MAEHWIRELLAINAGKPLTYVTPDMYHELEDSGAVEPNKIYYVVDQLPIEIYEPKFNMTFDGTNSLDLFTIEAVDRPFASATENHLIESDHMNGGIYTGSKRGPLYITVHLSYVQKNLSAIRRLLGRILVTDHIGELWFSDEPDLLYYAKVDGPADVTETWRLGKGSITFIVPDGLAHARTPIERSFTATEMIFLENKGSDHAYPVFDFKLNSMTYMIAMTTPEATFQFGETLEDAPQKDVVYSLDEVVGYIPVRRRAVTIDNQMLAVLPSGFSYFDISQVRPEWASTGGTYRLLSNVALGPTNGEIKIAQHAKLWQTGEKIADWVKGKTFLVDNEKVVNQSRSKKAYLLKDGGKYLGWLLEQDIENQNQNLKGGLEAIYGTAVPRKWYGPSIRKLIKGTPSNWQLDIRSSFKLAKHAEYGMQYMAIVDSNNDVIFSFEITANKTNRTANTYLVANGRGIVFRGNQGGYFMKDWEGLITINFMDDRLTLELRNTINNKMESQSWTLPDLRGKVPNAVVLFNSRYPDKPVPEKNHFSYVKFTGFDTEVWMNPEDEYNVNGSDPQNVFQAGDVIRLDTNDMKAYVNGLEMMTPIAYGSKATRIPPGIHEFIITTDEVGAKPSVEVSYREAWK